MPDTVFPASLETKLWVLMPGINLFPSAPNLLFFFGDTSTGSYFVILELDPLNILPFSFASWWDVRHSQQRAIELT